MAARETVFTVVKPFGPNSGPAWSNHQAWSGLDHLEEVVSLDSSLCPSVIHELRPEDWSHNVQEDYRILLFRDLGHLKRRVPNWSEFNLLAVVEEPDTSDIVPSTQEFVFEGFEVLDVHCDISALTNCGGFPDVFSPSDLNSHGLIGTIERAYEIKSELRRLHANEPYADCLV